ncbi:2-amino-4-hydroxy-6-hydroxymethyldihydropteridine diphosphokinase [Brevundimonas sp. AJA228-03]|uniref:2-amino-4-hydroxy-6- hydroxymethyldihydropteridine diphosphokinase n=1 Tax=Brevundimonas sp. AJA228-03 TaxID=2752515 RepID=UPI001AE00AB2|nr:2-amino-4-hydroxy-6-hydroxymethyldihydropteridine diphosphokinase [Brevundimonas sp. AJA228-03]QTN18874.1 2-amino-4-hydroxy-6-hydroxymethyldihydropteridine diphosphokinase [Brevundimonas sp. AJA228-03]
MAISPSEISDPDTHADLVNIDGSGSLDDAVIVALGCNDKGVWSDCREALEAALARFRTEGIDVVARSSWWASQAWPDPEDPPFLNGVVMVRTAHDPHALMAALGRIEAAFGRRRTVRNAPRTLDLDLIAYGREQGDRDGLILPHPRAAERKFVMGPLAEIAPDWVHPGVGKTARALEVQASVGRDARPVG